MLMIHLEESDALSAWIAAKDIGLSNPDDGPETKGILCIHNNKAW